MIRRNDFSVASSADAAQRTTIEPFFQRLTRPVFWRTPELGDSMMFVVHRHRRNEPGSPNRFTVNVSDKPYRRLPAAEGWSVSSSRANCSNRAIP